MKKILFLVFAITATTQAQIAPKIIERFPAYIVYKIYEVASKVKLTEAQQLKIGQRLATNDSIAKVAMRKGDSINLLYKYYAVDKKLLKTILSTDELEDFLSQRNKRNRFLLALKSASVLKLNPTQIDAIRKENNALKTSEPLDVQMRVYTKKLDSILTKPQYGNLLKIINADKSQKQANADWNNLVTAKMVTSKDSIEVIKKLYNYQLLKNNLYELQSEYKNQPQKIDLKEKIIIEHEPNIMTRYQIATNGFYKKNLFAEAILYEKELKLSPSQIDTLLVYYRKKALIRLENKVKNILPSTPNFFENFENTNISRILNPKQINILLTKKNEKTAILIANNNWAELEQKGMNKDLDKDKTLREFANYHIKALVARDRIKMDRNQINLFFKRDVELQKPELLQQLDAIKQTEQNTKSTKNALKW